jgi:hypothetical protein
VRIAIVNMWGNFCITMSKCKGLSMFEHSLLMPFRNVRAVCVQKVSFNIKIKSKYLFFKILLVKIESMMSMRK